MSKDSYIRLTFAVYRVVDLFPENEPLKRDIMTLANETLADLLIGDSESAIQNIEALSGLFTVAEKRNFVDYRNFLVLSREYNYVKEYVQNRYQTSSGKPVEKSFSNKNKKRQKEILSILKDNKKVKIGDLRKSFPAINRRTLLRDLEGFCQVGLAKKDGNGRGVCYKIRNATL